MKASRAEAAHTSKHPKEEEWAGKSISKAQLAQSAESMVEHEN